MFLSFLLLRMIFLSLLFLARFSQGREDFPMTGCSYDGIDYSGLSAIPDISFLVENPCRFPSSGAVEFFLSFCRPVSPNSSLACHEAGASICALHKESGRVEIFSTFPGNSLMKTIDGNFSHGLSIQGSIGKSEGPQGFINVFCPSSEVPGSPIAEYSPWLPQAFTSMISNSVNSAGFCSSVEFGFNIPCICPGSPGCENPLIDLPVDAAIMDLGTVQSACAGPEGTIFSILALNRTVYQSFPDGHGGFSSSPFAVSQHFFFQSACVWSPYDEALYIGTVASNSSGSLILRVEKEFIEEFVWFGDSSIMESVDYYEGFLFASLTGLNYTLSNTIFQYPVKGNKAPARTFHNDAMEGFGNLYINPLTGILYTPYAFGYYALNLKTEEFVNIELFSNQIMNFAFSNDVNGTMFIETFHSGRSSNKFPPCQISSINPDTGKRILLAALPDCALSLPQEMFVDSENRLWASNWGRLMRLSLKIPRPSASSEESE